MALHEKAESICLELGAQADLQRSYGNQASILQAWGRLDDALTLLKKKEAICLELRNMSSLAFCYLGWGLLAREQKDQKTEREKLEQALALFTELKMALQIETAQRALDETNDSGKHD
jgi:hypothetical protein